MLKKKKRKVKDRKNLKKALASLGPIKGSLGQGEKVRRYLSRQRGQSNPRSGGPPLMVLNNYDSNQYAFETGKSARSFNKKQAMKGQMRAGSYYNIYT